MHNPKALNATMTTYLEGYLAQQDKKFFPISVAWNFEALNGGKLVVNVHVQGHTSFFVGVDPTTYEAKRLFPRMYTTFPDIQ